MNVYSQKPERKVLWITLVVIISLAYAVLRYNLMGPVPWKDLPLYIMNKGISLGAILLLTVNFSLGPLSNMGVKVPSSWMKNRMTIGMSGFFLVFVHVICSLLIFKPVIYPKFFEEDGSLTMMSGASMLGGILSFVILWGYNLTFRAHIKEERAFIQFISSRGVLLLAFLLIALHLFLMGIEGWLKPSEWHGGLPPVSLVAFIFLAIGLIINFSGRK